MEPSICVAFKLAKFRLPAVCWKLRLTVRAPAPLTTPADWPKTPIVDAAFRFRVPPLMLSTPVLPAVLVSPPARVAMPVPEVDSVPSTVVSPLTVSEPPLTFKALPVFRVSVPIVLEPEPWVTE